MNKKIKNILSKTYVIGGSPCSGKSTMAEMIAHNHNIKYFKIDDYERKHLEKSNPEKHPVMYQWSQMSWDQLWMRSIDLQVKEEFQFYRERLGMIIMEGVALLPELVNKLNLGKEQVIFMIPSRKFQVSHYSQRDFIKDILSECSQPQKAFINWMERDHLFGKKIKKQAEKIGYKVLRIDGKKKIKENFKLVSEHFGLE